VSDLTVEVNEALARLRTAGTDLSWVEVKKADGGIPRDLASTVSAFANTAGGLILLGLDEKSGFAACTVDATRLADALGGVCADAVDPPVRAVIDIVDVDGTPIVAARIPELTIEQKPCVVKAQGMERGAYVRTHDGDRHLSTYEIHALRAAHGQPKADAALVPDASIDDLDSERVIALTRRLRQTRESVFGRFDDITILRMLGVLAPKSDQVTLAGLLALGRYPQQYFAQLNTTFVAFATATGEPLTDGTRFIDNVTADGPLPTQIQTVMAALQRNMKRRALIVGLGREDRWEYPLEAVREVLVNAHMHRDYDPLAHGAQVRVELYPDRLIVTSPGGLHGPVGPQDLLAETVTSSRNAALATLLEDVELPDGRTVCENRGTGLLTVAAALREAGMEPPRIDVNLRSFTITFSNHSVMDAESIAWLSTLSDMESLNDRQRLVIAFARKRGTVTNAEYRTLTGTDPGTATRELGGLAAVGLLERASGGRSAMWRTSGAAASTQAFRSVRATLPGLGAGTPRKLSATQQRIIDLLAAGPRPSSDLARELGITAEGVRKNLRRLEQQGDVSATAEHRRSSKNTWRLMAGRADAEGTGK
jgi:ATP-dependent DNA helicase RecG